MYMYVEVFFLDNFIMDALIIRLAGVMLCAETPVGRTALFSALGAALAFAGLAWPVLTTLWGKLACSLVMALSLPFGDLRGYIRACAAMLAAAFLAGGAAFALGAALGGGYEGGALVWPWPLRAALITAAAAAFAPRALRWLRHRRRFLHARVLIVAGGAQRSLRGLWDTGCALYEPLSGRPVITVYMPELEGVADIPVPVATVTGEGMLHAFKPDALFIDGRPSDALVALSPQRLKGADAIIPCHLFGQET